MIEADLDAAGWGRVNENPLIAFMVVAAFDTAAWQVVDGSVVFMEGAGAEVGRFDGGAD